MALAQPEYRPRDAEHTVLHAVIREHLEDFLREAAARGEGAGLPQFIEREFRGTRLLSELRGPADDGARRALG